jgi:hypothetical protein
MYPLLYKTILKPIWTYGIQLWGTASTSNIEILERFQSKALRIIVDAPWCVPNNHIRRDLQMTSLKDEIRRYSNQYSARLSTHPNDQILTLMELPGNRRLRRHVLNPLPSSSCLTSSPWLQSQVLQDWPFTTNQFFLVAIPLSLTARDSFLELNPLSLYNGRASFSHMNGIGLCQV